MVNTQRRPRFAVTHQYRAASQFLRTACDHLGNPADVFDVKCVKTFHATKLVGAFHQLGRHPDRPHPGRDLLCRDGQSREIDVGQQVGEFQRIAHVLQVSPAAPAVEIVDVYAESPRADGEVRIDFVRFRSKSDVTVTYAHACRNPVRIAVSGPHGRYASPGDLRREPDPATGTIHLAAEFLQECQRLVMVHPHSGMFQDAHRRLMNALHFLLREKLDGSCYTCHARSSTV